LTQKLHAHLLVIKLVLERALDFLLHATPS